MFGRWRQEDQEFKIIIGHTAEFETNLGCVWPCLKTTAQQKIYKDFSGIFQMGGWDHSPFLVLSLLLPRCHEVSSLFLLVLPVMMLCVTMGPQITGPSDHRVKFLRL